MRLRFLALCVVLLSACVSFHGERVYTGVYSEGREVMLFHADGQEDAWGIASGSTLYALRAAAPQGVSRDGLPPPFSVHARIKGVVSSPGRYGHLGMFRREIIITDVIEVLDDDAG